LRPNDLPAGVTVWLSRLHECPIAGFRLRKAYAPGFSPGYDGVRGLPNRFEAGQNWAAHRVYDLLIVRTYAFDIMRVNYRLRLGFERSVVRLRMGVIVPGWGADRFGARWWKTRRLSLNASWLTLKR
jgi:hypothetical protein